MDFKAIYEKAKAIIIDPKKEWPKIVDERTDKNSLIKTYALPMMVLGAISTFIGHLISYGSVYSASMGALVSLASAFLGMYLSALVINELAPNFASFKNLEAAFKLVIYSSTASYVATIISSLHASLSIFSAFSLYSIYLLWVGIGPLMKTPEDKKPAYVIVAGLIIIILTYIFSRIIYQVFFSANFGWDIF